MKKDEILEIKIEGYEIRIFEKKSHEKQKQIPIFYMPVLSLDQGDKIWSLIEKDCILVMIFIEHWNKDLSPWKAEKIFKGGEDFDGEGNRFCNILISKIVVEVEKIVGIKIESKNRGIIGYSMAGLFALYCIFQTDLFGLVGSVSGSLWFEGILEYVKENVPVCKNREEMSFYFSIGDKENNAKEQRIAIVRDNTDKIVEYFSARYDRVVYVINPGGHFQNPEKRIVDGIHQLIE